MKKKSTHSIHKSFSHERVSKPMSVAKRASEASSLEQANEWAAQANEWADEWMAQCPMRLVPLPQKCSFLLIVRYPTHECRSSWPRWPLPLPHPCHQQISSWAKLSSLPLLYTVLIAHCSLLYTVLIAQCCILYAFALVHVCIVYIY